MTQVTRIRSIGAAVVAALFFAAGCDETTVRQAIDGLGITVSEDGSVSVSFGMNRPQGNLTANSNSNSNVNANDNAGNANANTNSGDDRGNDNTPGGTDNANTNTNSNTNANTNSNDNDDNSNTNSNTNDNNSNDNTSGGTCSDGSTRLEGSIESSVELEAEYRRHPAGCARFRVRVDGYAPGSYEIFVNGSSVGTISVGGDGRGEREFDTSDGNFPAGFPQMQLGDVVHVGAYGVTMGNDCSSTPDVCNGNGNTNTNGNDNTGGNTNGNTNANANDNG